MIKIKNIIVPTDFSKLSASAFEYARDFAESMNAKVHLIHILETEPPFWAERPELGEGDLLKLMEEEAENKMKEIAKEFIFDSDVELIKVIRKGIDYEEIIKYSVEVSGDLIVIATHGRTGIIHTLMGSISEKVIRYSKCPVLVISPEKED